MTEKQAGEREHDFTLTLSGVTEMTEDIANALFEAGCDDATPCLRSGVVTMQFSRTAGSLRDAILSAIRQVQAAGIGAGVARIEEDHSRFAHTDEDEVIAAVNATLEYHRRREQNPELVEEVAQLVGRA